MNEFLTKSLCTPKMKKIRIRMIIGIHSNERARNIVVFKNSFLHKMKYKILCFPSILCILEKIKEYLKCILQYR